MLERAAQVARAVAIVWALGVSAYLLLSPRIDSVSVTRSLGRPPSAPVHRRVSWLEAQGPSAAAPFAWPLALCLLPALAPARARRAAGAVCTAALAGFCLLAAFSIGVFFLPSVLALAVALACDLWSPTSLRT